MPWDRAGPCPGDHPGDLWLPSLQRDRWSPLSRLGYSRALGARWVSVLEVLAANRVEVMIGVHDSVTPTPVISHAFLTYNRRRTTGLADGIVITRRTTHRTTADSNTTSPLAVRPTHQSPAGYRTEQMCFLNKDRSS